MKSVLPFRGNDVLKYSITYSETTPESLEDGDFSDTGYIIEPTTEELSDILKQAYMDYAIYSPTTLGSWESTSPKEDKDYFEKSINKYYGLHITHVDDSHLTKEEHDFITALLNNGKYSIDEDEDDYEWSGEKNFGVGGWIFGSLIGGFLGFQLGKAVGYGRAHEEFKQGGIMESVLKGKISKEDYFLIVRNWVYFTFNFPYKFVENAFEKEGHLKNHFVSKWQGYNDKQPSSSAVVDFYSNLSNDNREILVNYIQFNYGYSESDRLAIEKMPTGLVTHVISHWNAFCLNFPYGWLPKVFTHMTNHFEGKWSNAYERAGSRGAINRFFTELDGGNQRLLTDWVYDNYTGYKFEQGGEAGTLFDEGLFTESSTYAEGGGVININDSEGNTLFKGDKVVLITKDEEFLNPEKEGKWAERGDAFEIIRHLGESEGYDSNSNTIEAKHLKTGEVVSFAGFRVLKVNPQYSKGGSTYAVGGGVDDEIVRNKNKNDWRSKIDFYLDNNKTPVGKGTLIKMAYESTSGVDSAIPQSLWGQVDNTSFYVYDYTDNTFGELVDLREKLKFSNVKVAVTIVENDEVLYGEELPDELQNATFHQALDYVFKHDEVEAFDIRPKSTYADGGSIKMSAKKIYNTFAEYIKKAKIGDIIWNGDDVDDFKYANENNVVKVVKVGKDSLFVKNLNNEAVYESPDQNSPNSVYFLKTIVVRENKYNEGGSTYADGGELKDIEKYKKQLVSKAKNKGIYENFGQLEVRKLEDKYGRTLAVSQFDEWAMNYDGSTYADGGVINWMDADDGDSARVISDNKMGLIMKRYGRKFHLIFPNGTEKTYDASELEFYNFEDNDTYDDGGEITTGYIYKKYGVDRDEIMEHYDFYVEDEEENDNEPLSFDSWLENYGEDTAIMLSEISNEKEFKDGGDVDKAERRERRLNYQQKAFNNRLNNPRAKTVELYFVQGNYGQGFEDLTAHETRLEAFEEKKVYDENEPYAHRVITRRVNKEDYSKGNYKDGGAVKNKVYILTGYTASAHEDSYEQGELDHVSDWNENYAKEFKSKESLIKFINENIIYVDYKESDFDWETGEGKNIQTDVLCSYDDYNGYLPADEEDKALWKEGKQKLYNVHYWIDVQAVVPTTYEDGGEIDMDVVKAIFDSNESGGQIQTSRGKKSFEGLVSMIGARDLDSETIAKSIFVMNSSNNKISTDWGDKTLNGLVSMIQGAREEIGLKYAVGGGIMSDEEIEDEYDKILSVQILAGDIDEDEVYELSISEKREFLENYKDEYAKGGRIDKMDKFISELAKKNTKEFSVNEYHDFRNKKYAIGVARYYFTDNDVSFSKFDTKLGDALNIDFETQGDSNKYAKGGGVGKGYMVFNYTDNIYASDEVFKTKSLANAFIKEFRNRFAKQGYYRDNQMNQIDIKDIDLLAIPSDFNPFKKFEDGGSTYAEGGEINSVSELYDWEEASNYPYARDMVAYFIFGDRDGNTIADAIKGRFSKEKADESKLSEIMLQYEYSWRDNIEDLDVETVSALGDLIDYYTNYADGGGVEGDWCEEALTELIEETGNDELIITQDSENFKFCTISDEDAEYFVFVDEDSAHDYAVERVREDLEENPEYFNQNWLMGQMDESATESFFTQVYDEYNTSYATDIMLEDSEKYSNRLIEELVENGLMDEETANSENSESEAEELISDFVDLLTENQINEGENGYTHYKDNFGNEEAIKIVIKNNLIDIDSASENAVDEDGVAHFVSSYDGVQIDLPSGYVAYRVN